MIVGQLSDCNSVLKEKEDARNDEEDIIKPKLREKENEHVPNIVDNNKLIKVKRKIIGSHQNTCQLIIFVKKHNNAEEKKEIRNSNMHEVLKDNDDDERHE